MPERVCTGFIPRVAFHNVLLFNLARCNASLGHEPGHHNAT